MIERSPWLLHHYHSLVQESGVDPKRIGVDASVCDEAPLYTRMSQISFLRNLGRQEKELAIVEMGFRLWADSEANLLSLKFRRPYMLFLSIWEWDEDDLPNPYLFFCSRGVSALRKKLHLEPVKSGSSRLWANLSTLGLAGVSRVFEDRKTSPGEVRTIIDFTVRCSSQKILIRG